MSKQKRIIIYSVVLLAVAVLIFLIFKVNDEAKERKKFEIEYNNQSYRDVLNIKGSFEVDSKGVHYSEDMVVDMDYLYRRIAFINVFGSNGKYDYDSANGLIEEYKAFCETGKSSEALNSLYDDYFSAINNAKPVFAEDVIFTIKSVYYGNVRIENDEVITDYSSAKKQPVFNTMIDACRYYEENSDLINTTVLK